MNAHLVKNAEQYYRTMFRGRVEPWNPRDGHMAETLEALIAHLERKGDERLVDALDEVRLEQGIGVIYHPETERVRHYFEALLPQQFDAIIHLDETRAVEPLDRTAGWDEGEPPETFPTDL